MTSLPSGFREWKKIWTECASTFQERFGLHPPDPPSRARVADETSALDDCVPAVFEGDILVVNPRFPGLDLTYQAVIEKMCLQRALPEDALCSECVDDLSFEFARRRITEDRAREAWTAAWKEHCPPRKISPLMTYDPSEGYEWAYSVAGERGIDTIISELGQRARHHVPLTFDDYMEYFAARVRRFVNVLSMTDLKIVSTLLDEPSMSRSKLAKNVGVSEEYLSRRISDLQRRTVLGKFDRVPFSRINIDMFQLLLQTEDAGIDIFDLMRDCPFLYAFRRAVAGTLDAVATLCIPRNTESRRLVEEALEHLRTLGVQGELHDVHSSGVSNSFDFYRVEDGSWRIPWELLAVHLKRIEVDGLADAIPRVDRPVATLKTKLDDLDIQVLACTHQGLSSVTKIREQLQVGQHRVAQSLKRLRREGLITETWEAHNIGLNEHVLVQTSEPQAGHVIAAWSRRLPRCIISFSKLEGLVLTAALPEGGSYGFASALEGISGSTNTAVLSPKVYGRWGFPVSLWNSRMQRWTCPNERLNVWVSALV